MAMAPAIAGVMLVTSVHWDVLNFTYITYRLASLVGSYTRIRETRTGVTYSPASLEAYSRVHS